MYLATDLEWQYNRSLFDIHRDNSHLYNHFQRCRRSVEERHANDHRQQRLHNDFSFYYIRASNVPKKIVRPDRLIRILERIYNYLRLLIVQDA